MRFENCFIAIPSEILSHNCWIQLHSINYQLNPSKEKSSLSLNSDVKYAKLSRSFRFQFYCIYTSWGIHNDQSITVLMLAKNALKSTRQKSSCQRIILIVLFLLREKATYLKLNIRVSAICIKIYDVSWENNVSCLDSWQVTNYYEEKAQALSIKANKK